MRSSYLHPWVIGQHLGDSLTRCVFGFGLVAHNSAAGFDHRSAMLAALLLNVHRVAVYGSCVSCLCHALKTPGDPVLNRNQGTINLPCLKFFTARVKLITKS